jgi:hypothetical protein
MVNATPRPPYHRERDLVPIYRRLGGPQGRSGRVRKISPPPGFDPRTIYSISSVGTGTRCGLEGPGIADPGGRAVWTVGLSSLACWDCAFESHRSHECLCCVLQVKTRGKMQDSKQSTKYGWSTEYKRIQKILVGAEFFAAFRPTSGSTQPTVQGVPGVFPGVQAAGA